MSQEELPAWRSLRSTAEDEWRQQTVDCCACCARWVTGSASRLPRSSHYRCCDDTPQVIDGGVLPSPLWGWSDWLRPPQCSSPPAHPPSRLPPLCLLHPTTSGWGAGVNKMCVAQKPSSGIFQGECAGVFLGGGVAAGQKCGIKGQDWHWWTRGCNAHVMTPLPEGRCHSHRLRHRRQRSSVLDCITEWFTVRREANRLDDSSELPWLRFVKCTAVFSSSKKHFFSSS